MASEQRADDDGSAEGGDAACWLSNVCERCGAFNDDPDGPCWRCGGDAVAERPMGAWSS
jgi:hypothetical protein